MRIAFAFAQENVVTPEAQNAMVEIFRTMERVGGKPPTNAVVFAAVRGVGFHFKDVEAKVLLAKFRPSRPSPAPAPLLTGTGEAPGIEHERTSAAPDGHQPRPSGAGATRAGDKVLLVPKLGEEVARGRGAFSPAVEFGVWFYGAAMGAHVLPLRYASDPATFATADDVLTACEQLLAAPIDECKIRARRMIARKQRVDGHQWHSAVTPMMLVRHWEQFAFDEPASHAARAEKPVVTAFGASYLEMATAKLARMAESS